MRETELKIEEIPIEELVPYENNAKRHTREQIAAVEASIREFGFRAPCIVWRNDDGRPEVVAGHARITAAKNLGLKRVPCVSCDDLTDAQRRALTLADNQTTMMTGWDDDLLSYELDVLSQDFDMTDFGFECDLSDCMANASDDEPSASLSERFGVPPFSVLDARKGEWGERKRSWLALGIHSELGRGGRLNSRGCGSGRLAAPAQQGKRLTYNIDARATAYRG